MIVVAAPTNLPYPDSGMLPRPQLRVLVVDDDPVLTDLLATLLGALGHQVVTANTGELAIQQLRGPDVLHVALIDLRMPGMDGTALATTIATTPNPPRLVAMSGGSPSVDQAAHFHAFLHKPFGMEALERVLLDSAPQAAPPSQTTIDPSILDIQVFNRLLAAMPRTKLQDLYARTLEHIRQIAVSFDTSEPRDHFELAHTLEGSCAMVGATELVSLAAHVRDNTTGAVPESPLSYKLLRAADRLERILILLFTP